LQQAAHDIASHESPVSGIEGVQMDAVGQNGRDISRPYNIFQTIYAYLVFFCRDGIYAIRCTQII